MDWIYFNLIKFADGNGYMLVDDQGIALTGGLFTLWFASFDEAETYLENNNIRGSIR